MTETREIKIPFADAAIVATTCTHCGAELAVNLADQRQQRIWDPDAGLACAVCHERFDSALKGALVRLGEFFRLAHQSGTPVAFRVAVKAEGKDAK